MRLHTLAGSGTQRGIDYGRALSAEIAETAIAAKAHLAAQGHSPAAVIQRLQSGSLTRTAASLTPDLWDEVTALAGSSRVSLEDVLLLTFLDEVWALTDTVGCSVLARVVPGHPRPTTEVGQTMDLPAWTQGRMQVLRVSDAATPAALVMVYPGTIGLCGANEAGLGVGVNALSRCPWSDDGLGVAFILRHLLTLTTLAEAAGFLTSIPHAAGQAYTIAAVDGIATFEADASGVEQVSALDVDEVAHTNHRLASANAPATRSSRARLDLLLGCLARGASLAESLGGEVIVDGARYGDPNLTFGAFRAVGNEPEVRFIDGMDLRAGRQDWDRVAFT